MKKTNIILSCALLLVSLTGCEKYLNLKDPQSIIDTTALGSDEKVKSVLRGAYSQFVQYSVYGGDIPGNAELLSGNGEIQFWGWPDWKDIFNKTMNATNWYANVQWFRSYAVTNTLNNILNSLEVVNEADRDRIQGEALFLRGLIYFDLVRFYGQQYLQGEANNQMGVPLILAPTKEINSGSYVTRNSVEEIYNQVITDLSAASTKLPEVNGVYATSGAAYALLARVYLQKGDYEKARDASDEVIQSGNYSLVSDYAALFNNDINTAEDIFAAQITSPYASEMSSLFSASGIGGYDLIDILPVHLDLYPQGDKRKDLFYLSVGTWRCGKWDNKYGLISLLRLADVYLIRAECNIRLGTTNGASPLDDYNIVHTRAGLAAAKSVTLEDILFERRLELDFEGIRIHDIKRLHENVASYPFNDPKMIFPIPAKEIEANPALKDQQNPGY
jgi:starch-binding outer membrane protein, SusD/RagB family